MTIVRCPRCRDDVSVPAKATSRALVRCPLCLEQYLLAEAMAGAPPALVIIGGEVEQAAIDPAAADGMEYQIAGGFSAGDLEGRAPAAPAVMAPRPIVKPVSRPRKKEKNGLVLVVNYVLGGALGLALGLLLLWWGFRRDPLELGPTVAEYAPWIVPARFQGKGAAGALNGVVAPINQTEQRDIQARKIKPSGGGLMTIESSAEQRSSEKTATPPMPDLRDLLPDGPIGEARSSP